jgi:hypothetical protein
LRRNTENHEFEISLPGVSERVGVVQLQRHGIAFVELRGFARHGYFAVSTDDVVHLLDPGMSVQSL